MREICNQEWDDIQDRLKEKDAEIEQLAGILAMARQVAAREIAQCLRDIREKDAEIERLSARCAFMASNDYVCSLTSEIERLKALLRRAANQMEAGWEPSGNLIQELRKATQ